MTRRIEVIANELLHHHMQPGGTCTCGRDIRLGSSIQVHRAEAVDLALNLDASGIDIDMNHAAVEAVFQIVKGAA